MVEVVCREEAAGFRAVARHIDHGRGRAATAAELSWLRRGPVQSGRAATGATQTVRTGWVSGGSGEGFWGG